MLLKLKDGKKEFKDEWQNCSGNYFKHPSYQGTLNIIRNVVETKCNLMRNANSFQKIINIIAVMMANTYLVVI